MTLDVDDSHDGRVATNGLSTNFLDPTGTTWDGRHVRQAVSPCREHDVTPPGHDSWGQLSYHRCRSSQGA